MDYIARIEDISVQDRFIGTQVSAWKEQLDKVRETTEKLVQTRNMKGSTADHAKEYFSGIYGTVQSSINLLLATLSGNWGTYFSDYRSVDGNSAYVIPTAEVRAINDAQKKKRDSLDFGKEFIDNEVRKTVSSVSDLVSISYRGMDDVFRAHDSLGKMLDDLVTAIEENERTHRNDFSEIDSILAELKNLLTEMTGKDTVYKLQFSGSSFAQTETYQKLYNSYTKLANVYQKNANEYQKAQEIRQGYYEQLQAEEEERRRQAETVKKIALGLCIIGGIAATVLTAGAASPVLVATISGAATGAVMGAVNTAADMYTVGGWDGIDWGNVGIEALKGGIVGAATGAVSGAAAQAFSGIGSAALGKIPDTASVFVKGAAKVVVKGVEGGATKVLSGGVQDITNGLLHGESIGEAFEQAGSNMGKNFVSGFTKSAVTAGVGDYLNNKVDNSIKDMSVSDEFGKIIGERALAGGITEVAAAGTSRFATEMITGEGSLEDRFKKGLKDTFNAENVILDFSSGAASGAAREYMVQKPRLDAETAAREKAMAENAAKREGRQALMEKNGDTGIRETETGNLDFSESEYMYYTEDGVPGEVEIEIRNGDASGADKTAFRNAFREATGNENWTQPRGYSVHHGDITVKADGTMTVKCQLVKTEANRDYHHTGGASQQRTYIEKIQESGGSAMPTGEKGKPLDGYRDNLENSEQVKNRQSQVSAGARASRYGKDAGNKTQNEKDRKERNEERERQKSGGAYNPYQYTPAELPY